MKWSHGTSSAFLVVAVLCLMSCSSTSSKVLLPIAPDARYEFDQEGCRLRQGSTSTPLPAPPQAYGAPRSTAMDIAGEWGAVLFDGGLATIRLLDGSLSYHSMPNSLDVDDTSITVRDNVIGVVDTDSIAFFDMAKGSWILDEPLRPWQEKFDLDWSSFCLPLEESRHILVSFRERSLVDDPECVLQRIDRSRGQWRDINTQTVTGLSRLQACASDGRSVFLAGMNDRVERAPGPQLNAGRFYQTLLVFRVNLDDFGVEEVVRHERHASQNEVLSLAVRGNRLAVRLDEGELRVFKLDGGVSQEPYQRRFDEEIQVAWIDDDTLLVFGDELAQPVQLR